MVLVQWYMIPDFFITMIDLACFGFVRKLNRKKRSMILYS